MITSSISVKLINENVKTVSCYWSGYPQYTGKMLFRFYNDQNKAESIVNIGNLSRLDKSVEKPEGHKFLFPVKNHSVFYGRDRGDENQEARIYLSFKHSFEAEKRDYNYFWNGEKWFVCLDYPELYGIEEYIEKVYFGEIAVKKR